MSKSTIETFVSCSKTCPGAPARTTLIVASPDDSLTVIDGSANFATNDSVICTVVDVVVPNVAPVALNSRRLKDSVPSRTESARTGTVNVLRYSPSAKWSVPLTGVKSSPGVAVPPESILYWTLAVPPRRRRVAR